MKNLIEKLLVFFVILILGSNIIVNTAFASKTVNFGKGYEVRYDSPHGNAKSNKYHEHVFKNGKEIGAENADGTKHDGKDLNKVPNDVEKKIKDSKEYKDSKKKQKSKEEAQKKTEAKKLNWNKVLDIVYILAICLACGCAIYFSGGLGIAFI